jgi:hypothetical protein
LALKRKGGRKKKHKPFFARGRAKKNGKRTVFLPLLSRFRGEKGAGGLREVPDRLKLAVLPW